MPSESCFRKLPLLLEKLDSSLQTISNIDIITLNFPDTVMESEIVWMIGTYVSEAWKFTSDNSDTRWIKRHFFGYLKFKYKQEVSKSNLGRITSIE